MITLGCDIHMHVERFELPTYPTEPTTPGQTSTELLKSASGRWVQQPAPEIELWKNDNGTSYTGTYWYWGRNYSLFALLADVRNAAPSYPGAERYNYDPVRNPTGGVYDDRIEPIDAPRGLPSDVSQEIRKESDEWGIDGHSTSHFTLRELLAVDYDGVTVTERGWVDQNQYRAYLAEGHPSSWCVSVGGGGTKHVSEEEMRMSLGTPTPGLYCVVEWKRTLREVVGDDWFEFLDRLKALTHDDGSDVRAVFWFDN